MLFPPLLKKSYCSIQTSINLNTLTATIYYFLLAYSLHTIFQFNMFMFFFLVAKQYLKVQQFLAFWFQFKLTVVNLLYCHYLKYFGRNEDKFHLMYTLMYTFMEIQLQNGILMNNLPEDVSLKDRRAGFCTFVSQSLPEQTKVKLALWRLCTRHLGAPPWQTCFFFWVAR